MNKWLPNLENFAENRTVGNCPYCNSDNTNYNATKIMDDYGYVVMWCNDCKHSYIISRLKITNDMKTNEHVPIDLI